jgi:23S rRNA pseudouridine1911/1915/1917 synthase
MEKTVGQKFTVKHEAQLLPYLFEIFPDQSRTGVKNLLAKGQVTVNGQSVTAFDHPLSAGDALVILPKGISMARQVKEEAADKVEAAGVRIVYEDEYLIVADKPSGLPTISSGGPKSGMSMQYVKEMRAKGGKAAVMVQKRELTLYSLLFEYVRQQAKAQRKEDLISGVQPDRRDKRVWIVHRLDRGTSGLVLFAKDERTKELLQSKWRESVIERKYVAILEGELQEAEGTVESWLYENPKSLKMSSSPVETKDSQHAVTHYRALGTVRVEKYHFTRAEFELETGRKNQIRVHAADLGHPVTGDYKYGAEFDPIGRLALHAASLVFRHPFTGKIVRCKSSLPKAFSRFDK